MWAIVLKYAVMMQAEPEKAIQPSIQLGVVRFRKNKWYWNKAAKTKKQKKQKKKEGKTKKKKGEEEQSVAYGIIL